MPVSNDRRRPAVDGGTRIPIYELGTVTIPWDSKSVLESMNPPLDTADTTIGPNQVLPISSATSPQ